MSESMNKENTVAADLPQGDVCSAWSEDYYQREIAFLRQQIVDIHAAARSQALRYAIGVVGESAGTEAYLACARSFYAFLAPAEGDAK